MIKSNTTIKWALAGISFAVLWSSASTATKIGLTVAEPLVIAVTRFAVAAGIMLLFAHAVKRSRLPKGNEWMQIAMYGLLNIAIYLGLYVWAMQHVTAGIGALAVSANPVFISFLSVFILKNKLSREVAVSIIICIAGVVTAALPLFKQATVEVGGLLILLLSMISYSAAAVYFSEKNWNGLSLLVINGWQTLLGGLFLLPVALFFYHPQANSFNNTFWLSVGWLAVPVSIVAVQLWLWLLQTNAVKAGLWLFLCPLFGFAFAAWWMKDIITPYTVAGVVLVIAGLLISKINVRKNEIVFD